LQGLLWALTGLTGAPKRFSLHLLKIDSDNMSSIKTHQAGLPLTENVKENAPHGIERRSGDRNTPYLQQISENVQHSSSVEPPVSDKPRGRRWPWAMLGIIAAVGIAAGVVYYLYASNYESTDDAFIDGHVIPISSRVSGHVSKVYVTDNQLVKQGDLLVELDPRDFEAQVAAAEALLQAAQANQKSHAIETDVTEITSSAGVKAAMAAVEEAKAGVDTAQAAVATAESQSAQAQAQLAVSRAALEQARADLVAAEARYEQARDHLLRTRSLVEKHATSQENLEEATAADRVTRADITVAEQKISAQGAVVKQMQAAAAAAESILHQAEAGVAARKAVLLSAEAQLASAQSAPQEVAQSRSKTEEAQADVAHAEAELKQAKLNLSYTKIYAPISGYITRKNAEAGAFVQVGQPLLALVDPHVWVTANFKETQITNIHSGQPVTIKIDSYPGVVFPARVDSIQWGTGARFSLLPPENATGNYVKVVQRVPVKIVFENSQQLKQYILGPGMSVVPTVDIRASGKKAPAESIQAAQAP
jgi:membrane fusion protein (multidrug efflux system)